MVLMRLSCKGLAVTDIGLCLAVALDDGRETRSLLGSLNTRINDLGSTGIARGIDDIAMLADAKIRRVHAGDKQDGIDTFH